jgi:hypothetical protein
METFGMTTRQSNFQNDVQIVLDQLGNMLLEKNRKYGNSALDPQRTFSKSSAIELINVRIDDKLSRIRNNQTDDQEDPEWDLLGYLVLKRIAQNTVNKTRRSADVNDPIPSSPQMPPMPKSRATTNPALMSDASKDESSINSFADAMSKKMSAKRAKGRSGWHLPHRTSGKALSEHLRECVDKGDPVDVANYCMMLYSRGERIL